VGYRVKQVQAKKWISIDNRVLTESGLPAGNGYRCNKKKCSNTEISDRKKGRLERERQRWIETGKGGRMGG
jgi:hypothetical protein